jgi:hypothetical protein
VTGASLFKVRCVFDEILQEKRYIAGLQIATPTQFLRDCPPIRSGPSLNGVEGDDAVLAFVSAG